MTGPWQDAGAGACWWPGLGTGGVRAQGQEGWCPPWAQGGRGSRSEGTPASGVLDVSCCPAVFYCRVGTPTPGLLSVTAWASATVPGPAHVGSAGSSACWTCPCMSLHGPWKTEGPRSVVT